LIDIDDDVRSCGRADETGEKRHQQSNNEMACVSNDRPSGRV
jgi:hypothetical protein